MSTHSAQKHSHIILILVMLLLVVLGGVVNVFYALVNTSGLSVQQYITSFFKKVKLSQPKTDINYNIKKTMRSSILSQPSSFSYTRKSDGEVVTVAPKSTTITQYPTLFERSDIPYFNTFFNGTDFSDFKVTYAVRQGIYKNNEKVTYSKPTFFNHNVPIGGSFIHGSESSDSLFNSENKYGNSIVLKYDPKYKTPGSFLEYSIQITSANSESNKMYSIGSFTTMNKQSTNAFNDIPYQSSTNNSNTYAKIIDTNNTSRNSTTIGGAKYNFTNAPTFSKEASIIIHPSIILTNAAIINYAVDAASMQSEIDDLAGSKFKPIDPTTAETDTDVDNAKNAFVQLYELGKLTSIYALDSRKANLNRIHDNILMQSIVNLSRRIPGFTLKRFDSKRASTDSWYNSAHKYITAVNSLCNEDFATTKIVDGMTIF